MQAVIMAGGKGMRLRPLTSHCPKPLVPVLNQPILEHIITYLAKAGITEIYLTLNYLPEQIEEYFGDGSRYGVELKYVLEESPLGTAGSVKQLEKQLGEVFMVYSGDAYADFSIEQLINFHQAKGSFVTMSLYSAINPTEYGVVLTDEDMRIVRFLEKPAWGQVFSNQINAGIYILNHDVLEHIPKSMAFDFSKDLFPRFLAQDRPMYGFPIKGHWCDIGDTREYLKLNMRLLEKHDLGIPLSIPPVILGKGLERAQDTLLGPNLILGADVKIGRGSSIKNSVVWDNVTIGEDNQIDGAILANGMKTGDRVQIRRGSVIGTKTVVQSGAKIGPGVRVGSESSIAAGASIYRDVAALTTEAGQLFSANGIKGTLDNQLRPDLLALYGLTLARYLQDTREKQALIAYSIRDKGEILAQILAASLQTGGIKVFLDDSGCFPHSRYQAEKLKSQLQIYLLDEGETQRIILHDLDQLPLARKEERQIERLFREAAWLKQADSGNRELVPWEETWLERILDEPSSKRRSTWSLSLKLDLTRLHNNVKLKEKTTWGSGREIILASGPYWNKPLLSFGDKTLNTNEVLAFHSVLSSHLSKKNSVCQLTIEAPESLIRYVKEHAAIPLRVQLAESHQGTFHRATKVPSFFSLLELLLQAQRVNLNVPYLLNEIPKENTLERIFPCPVEKKAALMSLISRGEGLGANFRAQIEGFRYQDGNVVLLPETDSSAFRIISYGNTAASLLQEVTSWLQDSLDSLEE